MRLYGHDPAQRTPDRRTRAAHSPNIALPLWIAAIGLAVIAVVMIVGVVELRQALQSTQASVQQLQEQIQQLQQGLGGEPEPTMLDRIDV